MKNKKGFTLIELIVVIAILGILALFLVPSFMGYSRDAKIQVMKANVRAGKGAYMFALTKNEEIKDEVSQKKKIAEEIRKNLDGIECYIFIDLIKDFVPMDQRKYPNMMFTLGEKDGLDGSSIAYYLNETTSCSITKFKGVDEYWYCQINSKWVE